MLGCPIAAMPPRNIDSTEISAMTWPQSPDTPPKASCSSRAKTQIAATLGAVAMKAVTGVGAPS